MNEFDRPRRLARRGQWWCSATTSGAPRSAIRSSGTDDNFVGTELNPNLSYAKVARACGFEGVVATTPAELTEAIRKSCEDQKRGVTTFIEAVLTRNSASRSAATQ